jgi:hypothetical protein
MLSGRNKLKLIIKLIFICLTFIDYSFATTIEPCAKWPKTIINACISTPALKESFLLALEEDKKYTKVEPYVLKTIQEAGFNFEVSSAAHGIPIPFSDIKKHLHQIIDIHLNSKNLGISINIQDDPDLKLSDCDLVIFFNTTSHGGEASLGYKAGYVIKKFITNEKLKTPSYLSIDIGSDLYMSFEDDIKENKFDEETRNPLFSLNESDRRNLFKSYFEGIFLHEMGHSLGLMHTHCDKRAKKIYGKSFKAKATRTMQIIGDIDRCSIMNYIHLGSYDKLYEDYLKIFEKSEFHSVHHFSEKDYEAIRCMYDKEFKCPYTLKVCKSKK